MAELFADLPEAIANTAVDRPALRGRRAQAQADPAAPRATTRTSNSARDAQAGLDAAA